MKVVVGSGSTGGEEVGVLGYVHPHVSVLVAQHQPRKV
jgi:hypothetical protein